VYSENKIIKETLLTTIFKQALSSKGILMLLALALGVASGLLGGSFIQETATIVSDIYIKFLKLISTPLVFLSICSTISSIERFGEARFLGSRVIFYTLLTTLIAAVIGLGLFIILQPRIGIEGLASFDLKTSPTIGNYKEFLMGILPSNIIEVFLNNNVIGAMMIAFLVGFAVLRLESPKKDFMKTLFASLFDVLIKVTESILIFLPLAIWAFVTLFIKEQATPNGAFNVLTVYFLTVLSANLIQALVVLPILLKMKGYAPLTVMRAYLPALSMAFFTKSSNATLPTTLHCAQVNSKLSKKVSNFSLPLCVTCNMNACAAFILITTLFVASSHGITFSPVELILWTTLATIAAVGNAGVPMGCYFLTGAFLNAMDVPLTIMGLILPLYALLDMVETAVNVWSDGVIAAVVEMDVKRKTSSLTLHQQDVA